MAIPALTAEQQGDRAKARCGPDPGKQGVAPQQVGGIEHQPRTDGINPGFAVSGIGEDVGRENTMMLRHPAPSRQLPAKVRFRNRA